MNLDEFKSSTRSVKAPEAAPTPLKASMRSMEDLIEELKKADAVEIKKNRHRMVCFIAGGVLLAFAFSRTWPLQDGTTNHWIKAMTGLLALWYVGLGISSGYIMRQYVRIDYTTPLSIFLAQAEKRFRLLDGQGLLLASLILPIAVLCIIAGGHYVRDAFYRHLPSVQANTVAVGYYLFIALVFILGSYFTYKNWLKERAPYWREIKSQLAKLQSEDTES
jgi:TRAP-type C4-dicarboxylate transport system permease small subunit